MEALDTAVIEYCGEVTRLCLDRVPELGGIALPSAPNVDDHNPTVAETFNCFDVIVCPVNDSRGEQDGIPIRRSRIDIEIVNLDPIMDYVLILVGENSYSPLVLCCRRNPPNERSACLTLRQRFLGRLTSPIESHPTSRKLPGPIDETELIDVAPPMIETNG